MKDWKELFEGAENGALTYEQFTEAVKSKNVKLVDLNEGEYVSKHKYESELEAKGKEIETLNGTLSTRDTDLETLKKQLEDAGADTNKLTELTEQFNSLQNKYNEDSKAYKKQLSQQAYEFAVKEFANTQKFSSQAAKRDFVQSMIAKQLKMENSTILGADDFVKVYTEANQDAFVIDSPADDTPDSDNNSLPQFVGPASGAQDDNHVDPTGGFMDAFHFTPVRPIPRE